MEKLQRFTYKIKLSKKVKLTTLHVNKDIFKEAQNAVRNLILPKKKTYIEEKLKANTKNPKILENPKRLSLSNKRSPSLDICLQEKKGLTFDSFAIFEDFQKFYLNIAGNLVKKLPAAVNKSGL